MATSRCNEGGAGDAPDADATEPAIGVCHFLLGRTMSLESLKAWPPELLLSLLAPPFTSDTDEASDEPSDEAASERRPTKLRTAGIALRFARSCADAAAELEESSNEGEEELAIAALPSVTSLRLMTSGWRSMCCWVYV